jgi:hypothetical protein
VPAADLFTNAEFASYLHEPDPGVDNSSTDVVRRLAAGWLKSATGLTDFTAPVDDQLFGWALELAAIAYRNPDGLASESIDDYQATRDRSLRKEILDAARRAYSGAGQPSYSFPDPDWHWAVVPTTSNA